MLANGPLDMRMDPQVRAVGHSRVFVSELFTHFILFEQICCYITPLNFIGEVHFNYVDQMIIM